MNDKKNYDKKNYEIFPGKTLSNLFKDIYDNSDTTGKQVKNLVDQIKKFVKSVDSAVVVVPLIREYLDVKVKSDEHLVKMADTIQRLLRTETGSKINTELTQEEMDKLLEDVPSYEEIRKKEKEKLEELDEEAEKVKRTLKGKKD